MLDKLEMEELLEAIEHAYAMAEMACCDLMIPGGTGPTPAELCRIRRDRFREELQRYANRNGMILP